MAEPDHEERDLRMRLMRADLRLKRQQFENEPYKMAFLGMGASAGVVGALAAFWKLLNP